MAAEVQIIAFLIFLSILAPEIDFNNVVMIINLFSCCIIVKSQNAGFVTKTCFNQYWRLISVELFE